jgi:hypothetical protein
MRISLGGLCASLLLTAAVAGQNSGPASNGDFQFALTGATGAIQYNAREHGSSAQGEMTFTGEIEISNEDVDGTGEPAPPAVTEVSLTVSFDCLRINGNRAAMSGTVSSSSVPEYIGLRAVLAVQDNGEGKKAEAPDRFTWGVYRTNAITWLPVDAEDPNDTGATLTWFASDAERLDDVPVLSNQPTSGIDCKSFPFGSYAFEDLPHGAGNIQVKP